MIVDRRASSLFTTSVVLFFVGLLLFAALLNAARDLTLLCLFVFAIVVGLWVWTRFSPSGIGCTAALDTNRLFAGDRLTLSVNAENNKFLPVWLAIGASIRGPLAALPGQQAPLKAERSLLWYQMAHFSWEFPVKERGVHTIGPISVSSGDLFGFYAKENKDGGELQVIAYPRLVPIGSISLPKRDFFGVPGGESPVDDPVYIVGTGDYHHGRPARYIHWKASARHHRLQEKIFESTEQEKILIIVDVEQFVLAGACEAFERVLEVVGSLAVRLDRQGSALGFLTNGVMEGEGSSGVPVTRGPRQVPAVLETLARVKMEQAHSLVDLLRHTAGVPSGVSCLYVVFEETDSARTVREHLKRRRVPVVLLTFQETCLLRRDGYVGIAGTGVPDGSFSGEVRPQ